MADLTGWSARRPNADESGQSGATEEIDDDGFGEVVGGVSGEHIIRETGVTEFAGPGLEIGTGLDANAHGTELGTDVTSGCGHATRFVG